MKIPQPNKKKIMQVNSSFKILPYSKKLECKTGWARVKVMTDERTGEEYIDVLGGPKGEKRGHFHQKYSKDMTLSFVADRGILKSYQFIAWNARTGELLDKGEIQKGNGETSLYLTFGSNALEKTIWIREAKIYPIEDAPV